VVATRAIDSRKRAQRGGDAILDDDHEGLATSRSGARKMSSRSKRHRNKISRDPCAAQSALRSVGELAAKLVVRRIDRARRAADRSHVGRILERALC
jgi:hypothetical protein